MDPIETLRYDTATLDVDRIVSRTRVSRAFLLNTTIRTFDEMVTNTLVAELEKKFLSHRHEGVHEEHSEWVEVAFKAPASWWQAFKLSAIEAGNPFFRPDKIRMTTTVRSVRLHVSFSMHTGFPEMPWAIPDSGRPVQYVKVADSSVEQLTRFSR